MHHLIYLLLLSLTATASVLPVPRHQARLQAPGRFVLTEPLSLTASHLRLTSAGSTTLVAPGGIALRIDTDIDGVGIDNIVFVGARISTKEGHYGLITSDRHSIAGLTVRRCEFTAPDFCTNGVKLIADAPGVTIRNVLIEQNRFYDIGRMGVEVQNHLDSVPRHYRIAVRGNRFANTGLVQATDTGERWGQAVSVSGAGSYVTVADNDIYNPYAVGIEVTGGNPYTRILRNVFRGCLRPWVEQSLTLSLISLDAVRSSRVNRHCVVTGNSCTDPAPATGVFFQRVEQSEISRNDFPVRSWVTMKDCRNNTLTGNRITSAGLYALWLDQSGGNYFQSNDLTTTGATVYAVVGANGIGTTGNAFRGGSIKSTAKLIGESNGATNNTQKP
jgi:parallel beta-helix repeat protein